jgi:hypothetical protein
MDEGGAGGEELMEAGREQDRFLPIANIRHARHAELQAPRCCDTHGDAAFSSLLRSPCALVAACVCLPAVHFWLQPNYEEGAAA